jgi:hypothetical protein
MLRRLLIAVAALFISSFLAAEGFEMAQTVAVAHSKPMTPVADGRIYG